jgi:anti-sigma B factor antagonist
MAADVVVVELEGEFDIGTVDRVDAKLASFLPSDDIVIDLRRTTFVDSVTLARLVSAARRQATGGGRLVLAEASASAVRRVLSITQLDRVLPYADTVDAAVELLRGARHPGATSTT